MARPWSSTQPPARGGRCFRSRCGPSCRWSRRGQIARSALPAARSIDKRAQIEQHKGRERVLTTEIIAPTRAGSTRLQVATSRCSRPSSAARRPTSTPSAPSSRRSSSDAARASALRLTRLRRAARGGARACSPTGSSSSTRPTARHGHGRARGRRLRRPARAHRVHAAASPRRTRGSSRACATPRRTRSRPPTRLDRLEKRAEEVAQAIEAERDEVAAVKGQLVDRRDSFASARARQVRAAAPTRATAARSSRTTSTALEREQAKVPGPRWRASPAGRGGPDQAGLRARSSGRSTARSRRRSAHALGAACHAGIDIGVPGGHADPRGRERHGR